MASMIVLYGQPEDPAAFEDYYASRPHSLRSRAHARRDRRRL